MERIHILAISGSLRRVSSNGRLLRALAALAPEDLAIEFYDELGELPHFNPDLEGSEPPSVLELRRRIREADGVVISSPEYAHGVPGAMKNALDWVVGSGELVSKPVAVLNASPMAAHADASLRETLTVMSARLSPEASVRMPLGAKNLDEAGLAANPEIAELLRGALRAFAEAIKSARKASAAA
ncbi:MAG: NADPH-dependent FMN reductase [Bryobacteraceae bacterium]